jgi:hypothetical protein
MPHGWGTTRWRRWIVVPLLVVLTVVGADVALDDDWVPGLSNAGDNGLELLYAVARAILGPRPAIQTPARRWVARVPGPAERRPFGWIVVTPTDRAPPRV